MSSNYKALLAAVWCSLLVSIMATNAPAQNFLVDGYTTKDGLPHSNVFRVYQDKKGFIWFCTTYGLSRFDGRNFRNFYDTDGLTGNTILSLAEDDKGIKYIGTYSHGISVMNDDTLRPFNSKTHLPPSITNQVYFHNKIWAIGLDSGNHLYAIHNEQARRIAVGPPGTDIEVNKVIRRDDRIYFAANNGVYTLDGREQVVRLFEREINEKVWDIQVDKDGNLWLALTDQIVCVNNTGIIQSFDIKGADGVADLLLCSGGYIMASVPGKGILMVMGTNMINITSVFKLTDIIINDLFEDNEGNLWIATHGMGVFRIHTLDVWQYPVEANKINVYTSALCPADSGKMLIGSMGTITLWNHRPLEELPRSDNISKTDFIYFIARHQGKIFIGTPYALIVKDSYRRSADKVVTVRDQRTGCTSFCPDSKGRIWLGGFNNVYNLAGNELVINNGSPLLRARRYNAVCEDRKGNIWLGTSTGLIKYDNRNFSLSPIPGGAGANNISQIIEDADHRLWLATHGGLVYKEGNRTVTLTVKDGLSHNRCNTICQDTAKKMLWVGTLTGISSVNLKTLKVQKYPVDLGEEVLAMSFTNGRLFVGTVNGMFIVRTRDDYTPLAAPPLYITSAQYRNRTVNAPTQVHLDYNDKLTLSFIGISYTSPAKIEYRYKIDGMDKHWIYTANNTIELSALPPGNLKFLLGARLADGPWSSTIELPLNIKTPLWKAWWFILLNIVFLGAIVFYLTRLLTTRRELAKRRQLTIYNKIVYLKQQALTALINPHFIFNCMTSIQHYLNRKDNERASEYLADFARLIRFTLDDAQNSFINLKKELNRIELYLQLEQLRFDDDLSFSISVSPHMDSETIWIPNMILQPYVENAIWHGIIPKEAPGHVAISVAPYKEGYISISIQDDGIGIHHSRKKNMTEKNSYGLTLTEERISLLKQLLNEYCEVTIIELTYEGRITGTLVQIILPDKNMQSDFERIEATVKNFPVDN